MCSACIGTYFSFCRNGLCFLSGFRKSVSVLVTQLCLTLCDFMGCSLPGFSVHGILQARILEWVAIPFSRGPSQPRDRTQVSHNAGGFFTVWATREAQENWSGYSIPSQGIFMTQGSIWGLLHCRWILYQLSYQESPVRCLYFTCCEMENDPLHSDS